MFRQKKIKYWARKKPYEGQSKAKSGYCLSDHFHRSGLETRVCDELRLRKIAGDITDYLCEVPFTLMDGEVNVSQYIGRYYADFVVTNNDGTKEIIDAKGIQFPTFKKKWRVMEKMFPVGCGTALTLVTK